MTLKDYLQERYTLKTVKIYQYNIENYLKETGETQATKASYKDIANYIGNLRKRYSNPLTIDQKLYALKAYYSWQCRTRKREDHPCKHLKLRDAKPRPIQLQDLFTRKELEALLEREERYSLLKLRNQTIISLLIYQGLTSGEITKLRIQDINLENGSIQINASANQNERILKLETKQIMLFHKYQKSVRPKLLRSTCSASKAFILNQRGTNLSVDDIGYLMETYRDQYPHKRITTKSIRMSVITNLLKEGKSLRETQYFAGHKKISSTEVYRQTAVEELKKEIEKYHPLN